MANTFKFGKGNWATKDGSVLAYNDQNDNFKPLPFDFTGDTDSTYVDSDGLIKTVKQGHARIDYTDNPDGHLLLEPARTNSLVQSNQFDTTWIIGASALDLTSGQSGVYGSTDAWLLKKNSTGARYIQQSVSLSSAQYSFSVYLKAESTEWVWLLSSNGSSEVTSYFDLQNGVVGTTAGSNLDSTNIESVGNGWYRCTLTYTQATSFVRIYPADSNGSISPTSDNGIYIQHAQLEAGSYATSYIPTNGSSVTRSAETCNGAGNSEVFNDSEGVLYVETEPFIDGDFESQYISLSDNTTGNNFVSIQHRNTGQLRIYAGGFASSNIMYLQNIDMAQNLKIAVQYKVNDYKLFVNGVEYSPYGTPTQSVLTGLSTLDFRLRGSASGYWVGNVKEVKYYNTALSDSELEALTT